MSSQWRNYKATVSNRYLERNEGWEHAVCGLLYLLRVKNDQQVSHRVWKLVEGQRRGWRRSSTLCAASYTDSTCIFPWSGVAGTWNGLKAAVLPL
jgi:hypothetical protein